MKPESAPEATITAFLEREFRVSGQAPSLRALHHKFRGGFTRLGRIRRTFLAQKGPAAVTAAKAGLRGWSPAPSTPSSPETAQLLLNLLGAVDDLPSRADLQALLERLHRKLEGVELRTGGKLDDAQDLLTAIQQQLDRFLLGLREGLAKSLETRLRAIEGQIAPKVIAAENDPWLTLEQRLGGRLDDIESTLHTAARATEPEPGITQQQFDAQVGVLKRDVEACVAAGQEAIQRSITAATDRVAAAVPRAGSAAVEAVLAVAGRNADAADELRSEMAALRRQVGRTRAATERLVAQIADQVAQKATTELRARRKAKKKPRAKTATRRKPNPRSVAPAERKRAKPAAAQRRKTAASKKATRIRAAKQPPARKPPKPAAARRRPGSRRTAKRSASSRRTKGKGAKKTARSKGRS